MANDAERPRLRDAARTRSRILAAAQKEFSSRDYTQARLSDIAKEAGVNQALIVRYFGSKDQLFATALEALLKENSITDDREPRALGKSIVARLVDQSDPRDPLPMLIHAVSDPLARELARGLMEREILAPLARWLGPPDAEARAAEILLLCAGFFTYNKLLPLAPFTGEMIPTARAWLESALQAVVDKSSGPPPT
jgi:AcrR family transcriptional regulator